MGQHKIHLENSQEIHRPRMFLQSVSLGASGLGLTIKASHVHEDEPERCKYVRSEKMQSEKSPKFFEFFVPNFAPNLLRILPQCFEDLSCFVSWETETTENSPEIPGMFQCQIFQADTKKENSGNSSGEQLR